jgi:putative oxidoreductase
METALLIVRLVFGTAMAAHGAQKLFGWFGGYGLKGTGGFLETLGFRPGYTFALAAGLSEFGGGVLTTLGLLGAIGPALIISVMIVAIVTVHKDHGFFATTNGIELPLLYISGALAIAFAGPGAHSLDALLGLGPVEQPVVTWIAIGAAVVGAFGNLSLRRLPAGEPKSV